MTGALFTCDLCGADVIMETKPGRIMEYRPGVDLPVPEDFPIATCVGCGERYLSTKESAALDEALKVAFTEHCRKLIETANLRIFAK